MAAPENDARGPAPAAIPIPIPDADAVPVLLIKARPQSIHAGPFRRGY
jgi:hypothetical protein